MPLPDAFGSTWNMLTSLGLQLWQHMIVRDLRQHCITAEVTGYGETILIPRIHLRPSDGNFFFRQFSWYLPTKLVSAVTVNQARRQTFKRVGIYQPSSVFFSYGHLHVVFFFIWQRCSFNYWRVAITCKNGRFITLNILHAKVLQILNIWIHICWLSILLLPRVN